MSQFLTAQAANLSRQPLTNHDAGQSLGSERHLGDAAPAAERAGGRGRPRRADSGRKLLGAQEPATSLSMASVRLFLSLSMIKLDTPSGDKVVALVFANWTLFPEAISRSLLPSSVPPHRTTGRTIEAQHR